MTTSGSTQGVDGRLRCPWGDSAPEYVAYHDDEWGRQIRDDNGLYERMTLEGFQSGLSWLTILRKRDNFRKAFAEFDIQTVASYDDEDRARLLADPGIVRHGGKIDAALSNARAAMSLDHVAGRADLEFRSRPATCSGDAGRRTGADRRVASPGARAQAPRLPVRRPDHRLRAHAGGRIGERPPCRLLGSRKDPLVTASGSRPGATLHAPVRILVAGLVAAATAAALGTSASADDHPSAAPVGSTGVVSAAASTATGPTSGAVLSQRTIGRSVRHHRLRAYEMGSRNAAKTVVVIGAMHGNETEGATVISALMAGKPIKDVHIWAIRRDNPDGVLTHHRRNAHGVDLNRNFPTKWKKLSGSYYSGPRPASEPETRALMRFLNRIDPAYVVTMHSPLHGIDVYDSKDRRFARRLARNMRLPERSFDCGGVCHGTLTQWFNRHHDGACVTVEFGNKPSSRYLHVGAPRGLVRAAGGRY